MADREDPLNDRATSILMLHGIRALLKEVTCFFDLSRDSLTLFPGRETA